MTDTTAIHRLIKSLQEQGLVISESNKAIQEAITIYREQMRHAYDIGSLRAVDAIFGEQSTSFEQYFKQTYGNQ